MRAVVLARYLVGSSVRRYRVTLLIAAVGLGLVSYVLVAIAAQSVGASSRTDGLSSGALRTIQLGSYGFEEDPRHMTMAAGEELRGRAGVESAEVLERVIVRGRAIDDIEGLDYTVLAFQPRYLPMQPPLLKGAEPENIDEIVLPASLAEPVGLEPGERLNVRYQVRVNSDDEITDAEHEVKVAGWYDDSVPGLDSGMTAVYVSLDTVIWFLARAQQQPEEWIRESYIFPEAFVTVSELEAMAPMVERLNGEGYSAMSVTVMLGGASVTLRFLQVLAPILGAVVGVVMLVWRGRWRRR